MMTAAEFRQWLNSPAVFRARGWSESRSLIPAPQHIGPIASYLNDLCGGERERHSRDHETRRALGLLDYSPAPVCRAHGKVCSTQHKPRKTFEQNAAEYEAWLKRNLERLSEIAKLYE